MPKVAVLILNFNGKRFLKKCLNSLKLEHNSDYAVYLIDNASTDNSVEYVHNNFPWVNVVQYDVNYGFSEGYNRAICEIDSEYVLLLNNDVEVKSEDWLDTLLEIIENDERIGVVGPKLKFMNFPSVINSVGGKFYPWSGATDIGSREKDEGQYDVSCNDPFFMCGAAMLLRRDDFLAVGGFDSIMFAYAEDLDLCWRIRLSGLKVVYCPDVTINHSFSASWKSKGFFKMYLSKRNLLRSMGKNFSLFSLLVNIPPYTLNLFIFTLAFSVLLKQPMAFLFAFKAIFWNMCNLPNTLKERHIIQSSRKVTEKEIFATIGKQRIEPIPNLLRKIRFDKKYLMV